MKPIRPCSCLRNDQDIWLRHCRTDKSGNDSCAAPRQRSHQTPSRPGSSDRACIRHSHQQHTRSARANLPNCPSPLRGAASRAIPLSARAKSDSATRDAILTCNRLEWSEDTGEAPHRQKTFRIRLSCRYQHGLVPACPRQTIPSLPITKPKQKCKI